MLRKKERKEGRGGRTRRKEGGSEGRKEGRKENNRIKQWGHMIGHTMRKPAGPQLSLMGR